MDFLKKLDSLLEQNGLNRNTLSQKSGIPYTTIDGWYKKGYEGLKLTTLRKLAAFFDTTLDFWMLDEIRDPNYGKSTGFQVSYSEMEHIKKYRGLDAHGREMVDFTLLKEWERSQAEPDTKRSQAYMESKTQRRAAAADALPSYLPPRAARARTDIEVTADMDRLDDEIMDDENF